MKLISRILLFIVFCVPSYGQFGGGTIRGKVLDRDGTPLQGALIRVEHRTSHQTDDAKTNKNGEYSISGLFQGQYTVTAIVNGRAAMVKGEGVGNDIYVASSRELSVTVELRTAPTPPPPTPAAGGSGRKDGDKGGAAARKAEAEMKAAFSAGVAARKAKNYEEAITQFKVAAERDPSQPGIYQNLGLALANLKKYDDSAAAYRKAI